MGVELLCLEECGDFECPAWSKPEDGTMYLRVVFFLLVCFFPPVSGAIHKQRLSDSRIPHRAGAGARVAHGRELFRLLMVRQRGELS